jgi:DNA-binding response OmpR family regulator
MDLAFPTEKEGFSLLASIRNSSHLKDTPVIIASKSDNVEYRNAALKLLANDYIQKLISPHALKVPYAA